MTTGGPLTSARAVVQEPSIVPAGVWGRAAAILARQGLEYALRRRWAAVNWPAMADAKMKHQLIALPTYCEGFADLATDNDLRRHIAEPAACPQRALGRRCGRWHKQCRRWIGRGQQGGRHG